MTTDRIEKVILRAPRSRVWRAIANAEEFGTWFGVKLDGADAFRMNDHGWSEQLKSIERHVSA